jgi:SAM-dependent methyltransferase
MTSSADAPYPPLELATRVFFVTGYSTDPFRAYEEMGAQTREALLGLLPGDWSFDGKRVLDFGSGAGRTLRHFLAEAERGEIWGADIDEPSIRWLDENLSPPLHAWRTEMLPPLGLEHGTFDLIWAISVFTHLTDSSTAWLLELHRLLKPGGILIATYMGRHNYEFFTGEPWHEDSVGRMSLFHDSAWDDGGPVVFMSDWWVREHWGRAFEILEVAPEIHNMSWAVMRKRDVELTMEELDAPADDPREFEALRASERVLHRQLSRVEALRRQAEAGWAEERDRIRAEYESSLGWKLTNGMRRLRGSRGQRGNEGGSAGT